VTLGQCHVSEIVHSVAIGRPERPVRRLSRISHARVDWEGRARGGGGAYAKRRRSTGVMGRVGSFRLARAA